MASDASASKPSTGDEISLEKLVSETESAASSSHGEGGAARNGGSDTVDDILAAEDPTFLSSMSELQVSSAEPAQVEIDSLDLAALASEAAGPNATRAARIKFYLAQKWVALRSLPSKLSGDKDLKTRASELAGSAKSMLVSALGSAKSAVVSGISAAKSGIAIFGALPRASKLLAVFVVVLGVLSVYVLKLTFSDRFLPRLQADFLLSFSDVADAKYEIAPGEPMQDLMDPIFHPENVVLFERMVINLRGKSEESNPMGLFAFYIDVSTKDAAIELKDRETEARDIMSRTLEQMEYDELTTLEGKNRLKIALKKVLNDFLTRGRVRRVMFQNIVLKP